ncbi:Aim7p Ecym_7294 [Eremothecium cymbalariae DBVPG|uniref:ADF-H domain-containing protein n=1 Tax=Eremothecium cymbalariae (strain CBS 270.75 / DBVPG 7215 / KCTC 17166 / NRRL Y-17582) TaxID=931890 RepID=G8JWB7_ERECY|nr:hypothetical protein Ecym_7294 [Eremothecium cymbalariae DBVPG\
MSTLYQIDDNARSVIRKFRLSTSRSETLKSLVLTIKPNPYEVVIDQNTTEEAADAVTTLDELRDVLPDNLPRFVLLAYPILTKDGRKQTLLVMLYWRPPTIVSQELKMVYAAVVELVKSECAPNRYIEVTGDLEDDDEIAELKQQIERAD